MKVILKQKIEGLGNAGDEAKVKDGYARNYLIPRALAVQATKSALHLLEVEKHGAERKEKRLKKGSEQLLEKIAEASCTISVEVGEGDKLFGTVTSEMIAEGLRVEGIEIDKKKIILQETIKTLGVYNVEVRLHPEVKAQLRVWVVKK